MIMPQQLDIEPNPVEMQPIENRRRTQWDIIKEKSKEMTVSIAAFIIIYIMFFVCVALDFSFFFNNGLRFQTSTLSSLGANEPFKIRDNFQIQRLIFPIILHAGAIHILFNTFALFFLASLQSKIPRKIFICVIIIGGIQGNLLFAFFSLLQNKQYAMAVGFSSSICSLIGIIIADLLIKSVLRGNLKPGLYRIMFIVGYIIIMSLLPGVDIWGHLGGLLSGFLFTLSFISCWKHIEIMKLIIGARIIYGAYTVFLLSIFFI